MDDIENISAKEDRIRSKYSISTKHYHGDIVRRLFFLAAIIMVGTLPFIKYSVLPSMLTTLFIVIVGSLAGFISPKVKTVSFIDFGLSVVGVLIFESYSIYYYRYYGGGNSAFFVNEILAIIFVVSMYYSAKTVRGSLLEEGDRP